MIKQSFDAFEMSEYEKNLPKSKATKREVYGRFMGGLWEVLGEVLGEVLFF